CVLTSWYKKVSVIALCVKKFEKRADISAICEHCGERRQTWRTRLEERGRDPERSHHDWLGIEPETDHGQSAENQGQRQGGGHSERSGAGVRGLDVHPLGDEQVVEERDHGQECPEQHEPVEAGGRGCPE